MKDSDLLRGRARTLQDAQTVVETIAQRANPESQPQDYAAAIYGAVKRFVGRDDLLTALAVVEASGSDDVSPALLMIGQKYATKKDFVNVRQILEKQQLNPIQAGGLLSGLIFSFYDLKKDSPEHKSILQLMSLERFNQDEQRSLQADLEEVLNRSEVSPSRTT